jgi:radical SAM superfamily enzyme YgiQ (UPF0313 family)
MDKLKFTIVCPAPEAFRVTQEKPRPSRRLKVLRFCMLGPLCVAASAPDYVKPRIIDENVEPLDFDVETDVVGVTFMTRNASRAYEIGDEFRRRGKTVFFGGFHPTLMPDEAIRHCDAVCMGDAEANLPRMFDDLRAGKLQRFYAERTPDLAPRPVDTGLLDMKQYAVSTVVQATRGCNKHCAFCSITAFYEGRHRCRSVDDVVAQVRAGRGRSVLFIDDNIVANVAYAKELFRALVPLKKRWGAQVPVSVTEDPELLELMAKARCRAVFVGFESLCQESLDGAAKGRNRAARYRGAVEAFHRHGIAVMAAFVLGFDEDTPEVFAQTAGFLREAGVDTLQLTVLTPFPGTPLYARMEKAGRIIDRDWAYYDMGQVVFQPKRMSVEALEAGHVAVLRGFYSWRAILGRALRQIRYLSLSGVLRCFLVGVGYRCKLRRLGYLRAPQVREAPGPSAGILTGRVR